MSTLLRPGGLAEKPSGASDIFTLSILTATSRVLLLHFVASVEEQFKVRVFKTPDNDDADSGFEILYSFKTSAKPDIMSQPETQRSWHFMSG